MSYEKGTRKYKVKILKSFAWYKKEQVITTVIDDGLTLLIKLNLVKIICAEPLKTE